VDPIVRVQARRLRAKLDEYYAGEGGGDSLIIQIPKGGYVPVFETRQPTAAVTVRRYVRPRWVAAAIAGVAAVLLLSHVSNGRLAGVDPERSIAVLPLKSYIAEADGSRVADQVTEVLTTQLARNRNLRVVSRTTTSRYGDAEASLPEVARRLGARWIVEGGVGAEGPRMYVKLRVVDASTDRKVWADVFDCEQNRLAAESDRVAGEIGAALEKEFRTR
jgi:TolB-like protein